MRKVKRKLRAGDTIWLESTDMTVFISESYVESGMISDYLLVKEYLLSKKEAEDKLRGIDKLEYQEFYNIKL